MERTYPKRTRSENEEDEEDEIIEKDGDTTEEEMAYQEVDGEEESYSKWLTITIQLRLWLTVFVIIFLLGCHLFLGCGPCLMHAFSFESTQHS